MSQRHYQEVQSRTMVQMLLPRLDDDVGETNPVWAMDSFVDSLDLNALGFGPTET